MSQEIPKTYEAAEVEKKWYPIWIERGLFRADANASGRPFCIVMPPPNVTGSLHMGHALNITLQDILTRWYRMKGFNALWVPGTDHAGIATQNVVERQLAAEGLHRNDLGRDAFEKRVWEWKAFAEQNILNQVRRLGCSCDWEHTRFTLDEGLSRAVREVFVRLYEKGLIYRGEYLVNWCPRCCTAISDLEVEFEATEGKLYHLKYPVLGTQDFIVVATTRPETMLGDTAVAVHPDDERFFHLHGKKVLLPLMNREIPVICDDFVEREFGSGVVKVTPGHDPNDFAAGKRHGLPIVKVIGEKGEMTNQAGAFAGLDRYEARKRVVADLEALGLLVKTERHLHNIGTCQRCQTVIEPLVSTQWFVRVEPLAKPAIQAVEEGRTEFIPENFGRVYFEWMRNIHDWCISRQLWWGHRIPAWHCSACRQTTVSRETPSHCGHCGSSEIEQEVDVLDTWFSSALWPFSTLGWPEETADLKTFYPTTVLVTGFDIIFFWVARMMMMGLEFMGDVPFKTVHINGLVRDEHGQKMSKSRGNVIDPLGIIDEYGADAIRFTLAAMAVPGTDIPFSMNRMAGYRAFCNKIWNAGRFLLMKLGNLEPVSEVQIEELWKSNDLKLEDRWILGRLQEVSQLTGENLEKYRFNEACNELYHFVWREFCDWYIELVKNRIAQDDVDGGTARKVACYVLESGLRLLHPFIPFVTEEMWQLLPHRGDSVMTSPYPKGRMEWVRPAEIKKMVSLQELISSIRTARAENKVDPRKKLRCTLVAGEESRRFLQDGHEDQLRNLAQLETLEWASRLPESGLQIRGVSGLAEFTLHLEDVIDVEAEKERLLRQISKLEEDASKTAERLGSEDFLSKAPPQVVQSTQTRYQEMVDRLEKLRKQLDELA